MTKNNMGKINLDEHGRWDDCPNEPICRHACNSSCPQYPVHPANKSTVGSLQVVQQLSRDAEPEEVLRLWREGKLWIRTDCLRRCAVCGKVITSGYVWDGTDTFCSDECAASVFGVDEECVNMLVDGGRLVWKEKFND